MTRWFFIFILLTIILFNGCKTGQEGQKSAADDKVSRKAATYKAERDYLEKLFQSSKKVIPVIDRKIEASITWEALEVKLNRYRPKNNIEAKNRSNTLKLVAFFKKNASRVKTLYPVSFQYVRPFETNPALVSYKRNISIRPETLSLWKQCKRAFENQVPGWKSYLTSAYRSPAYQFVLFNRLSKWSLSKTILKIPPPYYSRHQQKNHDVSISLYSRGKSSSEKPWNQFYQICSRYHFKPAYKNRFPGELGTLVLKPYYFDLTRKTYIPSELVKDLYKSFEKTSFYLPDYAFSILIAMSYQEAGLSWNPKVGTHKKDAFRKQLEPFFEKSNTGLTGLLTSLVLNEQMEKRKSDLYKELLYLTDHKNIGIREYEIYLWTRKTWQFYQDLSTQSQTLSSLTNMVDSIKKRIIKLEYEPQTFGLWQLNINRLKEEFESRKSYWKLFPELIGPNGRPDRNRMILALSNLKNVMQKVKTLDFIMKMSIIPRYENHNIGDEKDMHYFIAENLTGEMSTYRAAIQKRLNLFLGTRLVLDGDLAFYKPYSTKIDWHKESNTQKALYQYIIQEMGYKHRKNAQTLIRQICEADSAKKLFKSQLYRHLMKDRIGERVFPSVKSKLYNQSAEDYVKRILSITEYIRR